MRSVAPGTRCYNFDGLDAFKAKFPPERWESIYAIVNERRISLPRTLRHRTRVQRDLAHGLPLPTRPPRARARTPTTLT